MNKLLLRRTNVRRTYSTVSVHSRGKEKRIRTGGGRVEEDHTSFSSEMPQNLDPTSLF